MSMAHEKVHSPESEISFAELLYRAISDQVRARGKTPPREPESTTLKAHPSDIPEWAMRQAERYKPRNPDSFLKLAEILAEQYSPPD